MMPLKNVILEISSKPFRDESEATMYAVAEKIFRQWQNLTAYSDTVSILLWNSDGSEILEYSGNLSQKFEWAYWNGVANPRPLPPVVPEREKKNTHLFPVKYTEQAAPRPYSWLKRMVEVLREVGTSATGKKIRIGIAFDNGPEFALSDFKYHRHREICLGNNLYKNCSIVCTALLHEDHYRYAAFPDGIPEGTSIGTFLGAQFQCFSRDLGIDYIWLSNGMGFGSEAWGITGELFDKKQWHPEKADKASEAMLRFWNDLTTAYPGIDIETRGSNYSAGTEIAMDAAPLKKLYKDGTIAAPVNSPWAALNFLSGLEIAAWMSHIAELPDARVPYRFYAHDPWFMNSPWLDRYGREPWDIYQPLSCARISENGEVQSANTIAILSIDNTWGEMPDVVPNEVIPHLLRASVEEVPDCPGPLLWIYPFDEYMEMTLGADRHPETVLAEDQFLGQAIQNGLPLNTVISTGNFRKLAAEKPEKIAATVKIVPVSAWNSIKPYLDQCGDILFYGTLAHAPQDLLDLLKAENAAPVTGECICNEKSGNDVYLAGNPPEKCFVYPQFLGGGITEKVRQESDIQSLAVLSQENEKRDIAWIRTLPNGQKIGFCRSLLSLAKTVSEDLCIDFDKSGTVFPAETLPRKMLSSFGWTIRGIARQTGDELPRVNISRHNGAFLYSIFSRNTTTSCQMGTPFGAPIPTERETVVENDLALWTPQKFSRFECRCFIKQKEESVISCKTGEAEVATYRGRLYYFGLKDAEVRFFPPVETSAFLEIHRSDTPFPWWDSFRMTPLAQEWEDTAAGKCVVLHHISGVLSFIW